MEQSMPVNTPVKMVGSTARTSSNRKQVERLMKARCRLMTREPWYGHIAMNMVWIPSEMPWLPESRRTMGVRIVNGGEIQCLYFPPFIDSLTIRELFAVIQHEIEHIVRCHCVRVGSRNPEAWNIAADMCVNGPKKKPRIGYQEPTTGELIVPLKGNIIWIPEDWEQDGTSEKYYDKLKKKQQGMGGCCKNCGRPLSKSGGKKQGQGGSGKQPGQGQGQGKGQGQGGKGQQPGQGGSGQGQQPGQGGGGQGQCNCPTCGGDMNSDYNFGGVQGGVIDDHSVWNQTDVSPDEARQVIKDVVDQATSKCQGHCPGHLLEAIAELNKPVVRWRELLRQYLGKHAGNQRRTYSRRNRRRQEFGTKGISRHAASDVTVIVDTSGSIGKEELQQFFAEIEAISARSRVWLLQWDHAFQGYARYRRGDWKKLEVKGRGGTDMAAPIEWLCENGLVKDAQIMLTDGFCNYADDKHFPLITVITTPEGSTDGPDWGTTIRMKIN
jgi:predicted metal-dependent peptidase